jgi:hypothetical protein
MAASLSARRIAFFASEPSPENRNQNPRNKRNTGNNDDVQIFYLYPTGVDAEMEGKLVIYGLTASLKKRTVVLVAASNS